MKDFVFLKQFIIEAIQELQEAGTTSTVSTKSTVATPAGERSTRSASVSASERAAKEQAAAADKEKKSKMSSTDRALDKAKELADKPPMKATLDKVAKGPGTAASKIDKTSKMFADALFTKLPLQNVNPETTAQLLKKSANEFSKTVKDTKLAQAELEKANSSTGSTSTKTSMIKSVPDSTAKNPLI
jgi:hypothetical protein